MNYEMKQIKQYTVDEVDELLAKHNKLVITPHYLNGQRGRDYLMGRLLTHPYLEQPYYEIQDNESISGEKEKFYLEWGTKKTKYTMENIANRVWEAMGGEFEYAMLGLLVIPLGSGVMIAIEMIKIFDRVTILHKMASVMAISMLVITILLVVLRVVYKIKEK